jgi:hypothetical protein
MVLIKKINPDAWLWWVAIASLSIGIAIFILLRPGDYDVDIQRYRSLALISSLMITGLCIIIGTRKRWFGK